MPMFGASQLIIAKGFFADALLIWADLSCPSLVEAAENCQVGDELKYFGSRCLVR
jgi:hypothetical protein